MKKLMLLGGSRYLIPVIKTAHELEIYTITADYLPDNIAHKYSDEYINVSVIDKEAVLEEAKKHKIDGIMSFACDPGVVTAAYVAEKMGLPFQCSYDTAKILQDKGLFRQFLIDNGFNCPNAKRYVDDRSPFDDIEYFNWPVIVKPTDSAGSKGVSKVDTPNELEKAIKIAKDNSLNSAFIIEDFLEFEGYHSSTDPFSVDGELRFITYSDQLFDEKASNSYVPAYIIWPTSMKQSYQDELTSEIQRLMKLLKTRTGIYNIESCVANGKPYIMEVSPRGGGCKIAELQKMAYGVDLIKAEIQKSVGMEIDEVNCQECDGVWCEFVVHENEGRMGKLKQITFDENIEKRYIRNKDVTISKGDMVYPFSGANMSLGDIFMRFETREELNRVVFSSNEWMSIDLE